MSRSSTGASGWQQLSSPRTAGLKKFQPDWGRFPGDAVYFDIAGGGQCTALNRET